MTAGSCCRSYKQTGANNGSDAKGNEVHRTKGSFQAFFRISGLC